MLLYLIGEKPFDVDITPETAGSASVGRKGCPSTVKAWVLPGPYYQSDVANLLPLLEIKEGEQETCGAPTIQFPAK